MKRDNPNYQRNLCRRQQHQQFQTRFLPGHQFVCCRRQTQSGETEIRSMWNPLVEHACCWTHSRGRKVGCCGSVHAEQKPGQRGEAGRLRDGDASGARGAEDGGRVETVGARSESENEEEAGAKPHH